MIAAKAAAAVSAHAGDDPLPSERYVMAEWKTVRASIDYHVEIDRHYYSVPYQLAGQQLEARFTTTTVELLQSGKRVASHKLHTSKIEFEYMFSFGGIAGKLARVVRPVPLRSGRRPI